SVAAVQRNDLAGVLFLRRPGRQRLFGVSARLTRKRDNEILAAALDPAILLRRMNDEGEAAPRPGGCVEVDRHRFLTIAIRGEGRLHGIATYGSRSVRPTVF